MTKMIRAKITYQWGEWPYYFVNNRYECRDIVDASAYDELCNGNDMVIQMGKVCVECVLVEKVGE